MHSPFAADVALVGLPNAGKSTLLSALSGADARAAPWAFSTVSPRVGLVSYSDAWALALAGRKRWALWPPGCAASDAWPVAAACARAPLRCVQMPGDVLYTPLKWTHETHNIDPAITVAVHRPYPGKYSDRCGFGPGAVPERERAQRRR